MPLSNRAKTPPRTGPYWFLKRRRLRWYQKHKRGRSAYHAERYGTRSPPTTSSTIASAHRLEVVQARTKNFGDIVKRFPNRITRIPSCLASRIIPGRREQM